MEAPGVENGKESIQVQSCSLNNYNDKSALDTNGLESSDDVARLVTAIEEAVLQFNFGEATGMIRELRSFLFGD